MCSLGAHSVLPYCCPGGASFCISDTFCECVVRWESGGRDLCDDNTCFFLRELNTKKPLSSLGYFICPLAALFLENPLYTCDVINMYNDCVGLCSCHRNTSMLVEFAEEQRNKTKSQKMFLARCRVPDVQFSAPRLSPKWQTFFTTVL